MQLNLNDVLNYVEENIGSFHSSRLASLDSLKLDKILKRKNPYLYKAKNILTAQDFVKNLLDAHLASQEETVFGGFLEGLAIFICEKVYAGRKSSAEGIDLEFEKDKTLYVVSIKSGPNWGNSQQIKRMRDAFNKAKRILNTNAKSKSIVAINGCCYGSESVNKGDYFKFCGQKFWEFISGDNNLYIQIIEPLGHKAKEKNEEFQHSYAKVINKFTGEFLNTFCENGRINWEAIVKFNSASTPTVKKKSKK
ncbi:cytosolic protein [bacterium]|nr:cytosolic protein [bacterium]